MTADAAELPDDPDQLRAYARSLQAELYAKTLHIEKLKAELAALRRARYGRSSEKLDREIEQLELLIGEIEAKGAPVKTRLERVTQKHVRSRALSGGMVKLAVRRQDAKRRNQDALRLLLPHRPTAPALAESPLPDAPL